VENLPPLCRHLLNILLLLRVQEERITAAAVVLAD